MMDQNAIETQGNQQVVMWWNPFDLVDNKNVQVAQNVQNIQVQQKVLVQEDTVVEEKWPNNFIKWLIKLIAKISGQPDPETGKIDIPLQNKNMPQNNPNWIIWSVQKPGNAFDTIMGWVTGFLDKVEEKIEKVSGVDIDSWANMPKKDQVIQQPAQQIDWSQNPVDQNIQMQQTSKDILQVNVQKDPNDINLVEKIT